MKMPSLKISSFCRARDALARGFGARGLAKWCGAPRLTKGCGAAKWRATKGFGVLDSHIFGSFAAFCAVDSRVSHTRFLSAFLALSFVLVVFIATPLNAQPESTNHDSSAPKSTNADSTSADSASQDSTSPNPLPSAQATQATQTTQTTQTTPNHSVSSLFVGLGAGVALNQQSITKSGGYGDGAWLPSLDFALRGGYQYKPFKIFGARLYLDYVMSIRPVDLESVVTSQFVLNIDAMLDFYTKGKWAFGTVQGVGVGYGTHGKEAAQDSSASDSITASGLSAFYNSALNITYDSTHRIEFGAKIPLIKLEVPNTDIAYRDLYLLLSYDYMF